MLKVAIVILNWNGANYLKRFLPGVISSSDIPEVKVFVADNASSDDSVEMLESDFPEVEVLKFDKNYGFAEGYNRAFKQIESEYFLLLNSDVEVSTNWLDRLIGVMDSDPLIAACAPKIKSYQMKNYFEYAGAAGGFIDKYGYAFCQGRIFDALEPDYGQYDESREVFWTTGACMFVRAPLYKLVGGFDPGFFAHFEEIDLCWRLKNRGYKLMYVPESTIFHVGGGALPRTNPMKTYLNFRNSLFTLYKNLPSHRIIPVILNRLLMDFLSMLRFLRGGKIRDIFAIFRAHWAFYTHFRRYNKFRAREKKFISKYDHKEIYPRSIVWDYFVRKKYTFLSLKWLLKQQIKQ
ncbi:MAG: glycosyltransferase family 2 protein [Bacteroidota bacterium]